MTAPWNETPNSSFGSAEAPRLDIEQLREHYNRLNSKRIHVKAQLELADKALQDHLKEAKEKYGTDDLEELKTKLDKMKADNEESRAKYQKHLETIEAELTKVEQEFEDKQKEEKP